MLLIIVSNYTIVILMVFLIFFRILRGVAYFQQKGYRWDRLKNFLHYENGFMEIVGYEWFIELILIIPTYPKWKSKRRSKNCSYQL